MARYPVYVGSWVMPSRSAKTEAVAKAKALGLSLVGWRRLDGGAYRVLLKGDTMRAVDLLAADLDYPPDEIRRLWPV